MPTLTVVYREADKEQSCAVGAANLEQRDALLRALRTSWAAASTR